MPGQCDVIQQRKCVYAGYYILGRRYGGGTWIEIQGGGADHNGAANGGGSGSSWFNLVGGDPFATTLNNASFALASPIDFAGGILITSVTLDSDAGGDAQDDFSLFMNAGFDLDDAFSVSGSSALPGLEFSLLNPGIYTRENDLALMTLTILPDTPAPVPLPAAVWLFGGGLVGLAAVARRRQC